MLHSVGNSVKNRQQQFMLLIPSLTLIAIMLGGMNVILAQQSSAPNAFIFTGTIENRTGIFSAYPDGSNVTSLNQINNLLPYNVQSGDLSSDGTSLVFSAQSADIPLGGFPPRELFSYDFLTSSLTQLTDDGEENYLPLWSPDGSRIAYLSHGAFGFLEVMEVATGHVSTLLDGLQIQGYLGEAGYVTGFDWSPSGNELVTSIQITGPGSFSSLFVIDVNGTTLNRILPTGVMGTQPTWDHNTNEVYYACNGLREICRLNLADQTTQQLTDLQSEFPDFGIDAMDISTQGTVIFALHSGYSDVSQIVEFDPSTSEVSVLLTSSHFSGIPRWVYNFALGQSASTPSPTFTDIPTLTPTATPTPSPTETPSPIPTSTPTPSPTLTPTFTATPTATATPPPNRIVNGDFNNGLNNWVFASDVSKKQVINGVLNATREGTSSTGSISQTMSFTAGVGQALEAQFLMGNNSSVAKPVSITLRSTTVSSPGAVTCLYNVPANTPLTAYHLIGPVGTGWTGTGVLFQIILNTADKEGFLLLDNVEVRQYLNTSLTGTDCYVGQPTPTPTPTFTPTPIPNRIINGTFSNGLANWSFTSDISRVVTNGVLNAYRMNASSWGGITQNMSFNAAVGQALEARFLMGNSSGVAKQIRIYLNSRTGGFNGSVTCLYLIPANTPLTQYRLIGPVGAGWTGTGVAFQIVVNSADNAAALLVDDVEVRQYTNTSLTETNCAA